MMGSMRHSPAVTQLEWERRIGGFCPYHRLAVVLDLALDAADETGHQGDADSGPRTPKLLA